MLDVTRLSVEAYCAHLGKDPLLVQGAGGNISWKDGDTLWVKASGMWMAEALQKDIFVPINLPDFTKPELLQKFEFSLSGSDKLLLRPSIETMLHAVMPKKIVLHLHAIDILSIVVNIDCFEILSKKLSAEIQWKIIDYAKPGSDLAQAVCREVQDNPLVQVIFLKNHGVVIQGDSLDEVDKFLRQILCDILGDKPALCFEEAPKIPTQNFEVPNYILLTDREIQQLVFDEYMFNCLLNHWALYPDHVVFLGALPEIYYSRDEVMKKIDSPSNSSDIIFVKKEGVFIRSDISNAKIVQLRCYWEVLSRQNSNSRLMNLTHTEVIELLGWEAEKYRSSLSKDL